MTTCKIFVKVELTWVLPDGGHRTGDGGVGVCSQWVCRGGVSWQEVLKLNRNWRSRNTAQIIQNKTVIFFDSNDPVPQILLTSSQHHRASPNCLNLTSKDTTKKLQTVTDYYCTYVNVKKTYLVGDFKEKLLTFLRKRITKWQNARRWEEVWHDPG